MTHFRWRCWRKNQLQPIPVPTEEVDVRDQHRTCDDSRPRERRSNRDGNHEDVHDDGQVQESTERHRARDEQQTTGDPLSHADELVVPRGEKKPAKKYPTGSETGNVVNGSPMIFTSPEGTKARTSRTRTAMVKTRGRAARLPRREADSLRTYPQIRRELAWNSSAARTGGFIV